MITDTLLCEQFIAYLSDTYIDFNGDTKTGQNELNLLLTDTGIDKQLIGNYSNGYQQTWTEDFCMVLQTTNKLNKNTGLMNFLSYEETEVLTVEIKMTGTSNILYVLVNYMPKIMNILIVNFLNDTSKVLGWAYYNLQYDTNSYLESSQVESPNPYSTVTSIYTRQNITVNRQTKIRSV